jgi:DNA mismatch repair protein MutH
MTSDYWKPPPPPQTEEELMVRANILVGRPLGDLARRAGASLPGEMRSSKGWAGQLLERILGASAGSRAEPDFVQIGVELKSLPVSLEGAPSESTYVTVVPLLEGADAPFEESVVAHKLARVLWFPIEADASKPLVERRVGTAFLWSPNEEEGAVLRADWDHLMGKVMMGQVDEITAHEGEVLQIRPKGANRADRVKGYGPDGTIVPLQPRGFYLRPRFTAAILKRALGLP